MKHTPVPYTIYTYLTRVDLSGSPEIFTLHTVLWMPKNYTILTWDNKNPEGIHMPEICYHRLVLIDAEPDADDDLKECVPVTWSEENFKKPEDKDFIEVYYEIANEARIKIVKKPKAKMAYAHADIGGAGPQPPDRPGTYTAI